MRHLRTEAVITGGGLAGVTLAHLLAQNGIESIVLNQDTAGKNRNPGYDPRALSITPASKRILSSINIWENLATDKIGHFRKIHVWDAKSGGEISFDCSEICEPVLGYIIDQSMLQQVLTEAMSISPFIEEIRVTEPLSFDDKADEITVNSGKDISIRAEVLVAADGAKSPLRELAGIGFPRQDYHQTAVACIVQTELAHNNISRQRFLPDGPLAFLPRADENSCGVVWSISSWKAEKIMAMSEQEFHNSLQQAFDYRLGKVIHSEPKMSFKLFSANADKYCQGRCVLVGDAAHVVHPLAGQGANMGFLDVATLAELFALAKVKDRRISSRGVLRRYERWRKAENFRMSITLEIIKEIYERDTGLIRLIRGMGMNQLDSIDIVKNRIMKHAMGLAGNLPDVIHNETNQGIN